MIEEELVLSSYCSKKKKKVRLSYRGKVERSTDRQETAEICGRYRFRRQGTINRLHQTTVTALHVLREALLEAGRLEETSNKKASQQV